ncbi:hypothetical protein [Endozoicomonas sp. 8E]|uniref:tetratricopeptide repeat protein n=1 Tax=Endozoicomonas sp. 8E TaxID=3035692 RepID=UPI002938F855|nr:hypothetical protein [Endozoicomonas sp. 8E]WOG26212.1 hypothetical protein P6910_16800 [Endozoicomonas sp. 8E]
MTIKARIDESFTALNRQRFSDAEAAFRAILQETWLSTFNYQNVTMGLARSLNAQSREKQEKARFLLEKLRQKGSVNKFGASTIHNLDLTLSRCEQGLGQHLKAEARLLALRNKKHDADEETLCEPTGNFEIDIAAARHWQIMSKYKLTETLLLKMKAALDGSSHSFTFSSDVNKLHKYLHIVNLALARNWQLTGKHKACERLLLNMSSKKPDGSEESLCKPCKDHEINLALVRHWQAMGKYKLAERLLLNMGGEHPEDSKETPRKARKHHDINLALMRLWHVMEKHEQAERLLLNLSGKNPDGSEESLCTPCKDHEINLTLARHWQATGKYKLAERLLLNMSKKYLGTSMESHFKSSAHYVTRLALTRLWQEIGEYEQSERLLLKMAGKHPGDDEYSLCKPSGHYDIDLALVRCWEMVGNHKLAEGLLLNMIDKHPDASEEVLCKPSGYHDADLALARQWQRAGQYEQAEKLLRHCNELYHSNECELALLVILARQAEFMEIIAGYPENANTLLATSIHYFIVACQQITNGGPEPGHDNLNKALKSVETVIEIYSPNAGALSQKAHCLRMMGASEKEWKYWFDKSGHHDSSRAQKSKTDYWRSIEASALQKVRSSMGQT